MKAQRVCAWCLKILGETDTTDGEPSHGICNDCLLKHFGVTPAQLKAAITDATLRAGPRPKEH